MKLQFEVLKVGHCNHPECIAMRGGSWQSIRFPALCGLIRHPEHGIILYDTGYASHFFKATKGIPECLYRRVTPVQLDAKEELLYQLDERGIQASGVKWIIISHFHADHIAGLSDFDNCTYLATRSEYQTMKSAGRLKRLRRAFLRDLLPQDFEDRLKFAETCPVATLPESMQAFHDAWDLFLDGSLMGVNLPGHTASQLGLYFKAQNGQDWFLVADACWSIAALQNASRPHWLARRIFANQQDYDETFSRLCQLYQNAKGPRILPSHCDASWKEICSS